MNRQFGVVLAIGAVLTVAASGAVALNGGSAAPIPDEQPVDGATIQSDNETLTLQAAQDQVVRGQTDVAPGESLTVRLQSAGNASTPFIRTATTTVAEDGSFAVSVDLATVGDQPAFVATVRHDGEELTNTSGQVVGKPTDADGDTEPTGSVANTHFVVDGDRLTVPATTAATLDAETDLEPGTEVAVRLRSTNGSAPFLKSQPAMVSEDGSLSATFNLTSIEPGMKIEVSVYDDNETLVRQSGFVTAPA